MWTIIDGQKIAKRLSASITKETSTARKLLEEYNVAAAQVKETYIPLTEDEVLNSWQPAVESSKLPWNTNKDITSAYLLMQRTEEELRLLKEEMQNVLTYCRQSKEAVTRQIDLIQSDEEQYSNTLLLSKLEDIEL